MNITLNNLLDRQALSQSVAQRAVGHFKLDCPFLYAKRTAIVRDYSGCAFFGRSCWFGQCLFDSPLIQSNPQRAVSYAEPFCPVKQAKGFSFVSQHARFTTVLRLLFLAGPATIIWGVWTIGIGISVNRRFWEWLLAHVLQKVHERVFPSVANCYSSSTIEFVVRGVRVVATGFHATPNDVFRRAWLAFQFWRQLIRIFRSHLTFPENDWVDRAGSVCNTASARFILA